MHRLAILALALLALLASVLPPVLARETNAARLRRGDPPLPPSRREVARHSQPSSWPWSRSVLMPVPSRHFMFVPFLSTYDVTPI